LTGRERGIAAEQIATGYFSIGGDGAETERLPAAAV